MRSRQDCLSRRALLRWPRSLGALRDAMLACACARTRRVFSGHCSMRSRQDYLPRRALLRWPRSLGACAMPCLHAHARARGAFSLAIAACALGWTTCCVARCCAGRAPSARCAMPCLHAHARARGALLHWLHHDTIVTQRASSICACSSACSACFVPGQPRKQSPHGHAVCQHFPVYFPPARATCPQRPRPGATRLRPCECAGELA